jgi:hypothetical protein
MLKTQLRSRRHVESLLFMPQAAALHRLVPSAFSKLKKESDKSDAKL